MLTGQPQECSYFWARTTGLAKKENIRSVDFQSNMYNNVNVDSGFETLSWRPVCLQYFDNVYIPGDVKNCLFTHGLWNI